MSAEDRPGRLLHALLSATDWLFILYWTASALDLVGVVHLPRDWLYPHHDDPRVVAWNWSFLPLDLAFSAAGLFALHQAKRPGADWRTPALVSLVLTMCAGGMAVSYWTLAQEFDPAWFMPNLFLLLWPIPFLPRLLSPSSRGRGPSS